MLNKFKNVLTEGRQKDIEPVQRKVDISILSGDEVKVYRKLMDQFKENVEQLEEISRTNKEDILAFIEQQSERNKDKEVEGQKQQKDEQQQEQQFILTEDLKEIQNILKEVYKQLDQIVKIESDIKSRVQAIQENQSADKVNQLQGLIAKLQADNKKYIISEENNRQIMSTLNQQTQLYLKEIKQLQDKSIKMDKQVKEKTQLVHNLNQEKSILLQMRNTDHDMKHPEIEGLKGQLAEFDKRLTFEKTKVQQKQKEIQGLKKKLEQERESLQKVADELKEKQLKSKKILDKYDRSKAEIRKYREEKTEFIKKLNMENADLNTKIQELSKENTQLHEKLRVCDEKIEGMETQIHKIQNRSSELQSIKTELIEVRKEVLQKNHEANGYLQQIEELKKNNDQLHQKRKGLLESLQKPVNHEIKTLEKIIRGLEKLYKEYITTVFEQGNVVGFQTKITYLMTNVQEIKEDLLL